MTAQAEWGYVYAGSILVSAVDETGRNQVDTLQVGDIWYFPKGSAHTIQGKQWTYEHEKPLANNISLGLEEDNEYLLAFDDGVFSGIRGSPLSF